MFIVRGTKKFRERVTPVDKADGDPTTVLGDWYATVLFWRPQVALFVDQRTLLPVLVPFAPASTVLRRFRGDLGQVLDRLGVPAEFITAEVAEMASFRLEPTASRSVLGMMNEFAFLAEAFARGNGRPDLIAISSRLAATPCGPLQHSHGFPDRELAAIVASAASSSAAGSTEADSRRL